LPAALAPGTYSLIAGAYLSGPTGLENMQPQCSNASGTAIRLGEIKVRAKL